MNVLLRGLRLALLLAWALIYAVVNAVYKTVTRFALYAVTAYLVAYFSLNSDALRDELMGFVSDLIPGSTQMATLQWGPWPADVTLLDVDIRDRTGTSIIRVDVTDASLDMPAFAWWIVRQAAGTADRFELELTKGHVYGVDVFVEVDADGWSGMEGAFDDVSRPPNPGRAAYVKVDDAVVKGGQVRVDVKGAGVRGVARGLDIIDARVLVDNKVTTVIGPQLNSSDGWFSVDGAGAGGGPLRMSFTDLHARFPEWRHGLLVIDAAWLTLSKSEIQVGGRLDTRGEVTTVDARATVKVPRGEPVLDRYAGDSVELAGQVEIAAEGPLGWPTLAMRLEAEELEIAGIDASPLTLQLRLRRDPWRTAAELAPVSLTLGGSVIHLDRATWFPDEGGRTLGRVEADLRLDPLRPGALWAMGLLPFEPPEPLASAVAGRVSLGADWLTDGVGGTEWAIDTDLQLVAAWAGGAGVPLAPVYTLTGPLSARVGSRRDRIQTSGLTLDSGGDSVRLDGTLDLADLGLDVGVLAQVDLRDLLSTWDVRAVSGVATLAEALVTGTTASPDLAGELLVTGGAVADARVERLTADLRLQEGALDVNRLTAATDWGKLRADASLRLWDGLITNLSPRMPLELRRVDVTGVDLGRLRIEGLEGIATAKSRRFDLALRERGLAPRGSASLSVAGLQAFGESFQSASAEVTADARRLKVTSLEARTQPGATLSARGTWDYRRGTIDASADVSSLDLATTGLLKRTRLPVKGVIGTHVEAEGPLERPRLSGWVKAARLAWEGLPLGDARIRFDMAENRRSVAITSEQFFRSFTLKEATMALGAGGRPQGLVARLGLEKLDLAAFLPALDETLPAARIAAGEVLVDVDFTGRDPLRVVADLPGGALTVDFGSEHALSNDGPLWASLVGNVVSVERFIASWAGQRMATCGQLRLDGPLDFDLAGSVDLHLIDQLRRYVADVQGRLVTHLQAGGDQPPPPRAETFSESCLMLAIDDPTRQRLGDPAGFVRVRNALSAPVIEGALRFDGVQMRPRGLGRDVTIRSGTVILRGSSGLQGSQEIEIPESDPIRGNFDEGLFRISGIAKLPEVPARTKLEHWMPNKGIVRLSGEDIYWAEPKEYRVTLDPDVQLRFSDLWQPIGEERARLPAAVRRNIKPTLLKLTGQVVIPEGAYFRAFTFLAQSFGNVLGQRTVQAYSQDLDQAFPLLKEMRFDLQVRGANFLVRSDFGVGSTDLDTRFALDVRGSFENPRLHGNVQVSDGTITYNVFKRVFEVSQGTLDFDGPPDRPVLNVRAETTIEAKKPGLVRQGDEYEDYTVTVDVTGRVPDYKIALSSKPSLPEIDVQYLVLLGKTKQQLNEEGFGGASLDVISADLSQFVSELIQAPFVDNLTVEPTLTGGGRVEAIFRLGQRIRIGVVGRQEGGVTTYDTRYRQKILDNLVLEAIRRGPGESTRDRERYEVQLKYTVPVD